MAFQREGHTVLGWALNISQGGLRAILEEQVELGLVFEILLGDAQEKRQGRVVWVQDEPDGAIVGVAFMGDTAAVTEGAPSSGATPLGESAQPARSSRPGLAPREAPSERRAT